MSVMLRTLLESQRRHVLHAECVICRLSNSTAADLMSGTWCCAKQACVMLGAVRLLLDHVLVDGGRGGNHGLALTCVMTTPLVFAKPLTLAPFMGFPLATTAFAAPLKALFQPKGVNLRI